MSAEREDRGPNFRLKGRDLAEKLGVPDRGGQRRATKQQTRDNNQQRPRRDQLWQADFRQQGAGQRKRVILDVAKARINDWLQ